MLSQHNTVINRDEVVYANGYRLPMEQTGPALGHRLFLIFRSGKNLTLHNDFAILVGNNLGIEEFPEFSN